MISPREEGQMLDDDVDRYSRERQEKSEEALRRYIDDLSQEDVLAHAEITVRRKHEPSIDR